MDMHVAQANDYFLNALQSVQVRYTYTTVSDGHNFTKARYNDPAHDSICNIATGQLQCGDWVDTRGEAMRARKEGRKFIHPW